MSVMDAIFASLGMVVFLWFMSGFLWLLLCVKVTMPPAPWHPPLTAKIGCVVAFSFAAPWLFMTTGSLPTGIVMGPTDVPPEDKEKFNEWMKDHCPCRSCRERRGEI